MTVTDERGDLDPLGVQPAGQPGSARAAINQMIEAGLLDDVMARADAGELRLTGEGGFLPEIIKAVLERGLAAELTGHLGYEKGAPAPFRSKNHPRRMRVRQTLPWERWRAALDAVVIGIAAVILQLPPVRSRILIRAG